MGKYFLFIYQGKMLQLQDVGIHKIPLRFNRQWINFVIPGD